MLDENNQSWSATIIDDDLSMGFAIKVRKDGDEILCASASID